jgi:hypothetical protein
MPDHWSFVVSAYVLAAIAFGGYWRRLARIERDLETRATRPRRRR